MTLPSRSRRIVTYLSLALTATVFAMTVQAQTRFAVSSDGQEVQDSQTSLTWRRCAEGMNWDGKTCAGKASKFSYAAAVKQASAVAAKGAQGWRLPTRAELLTLVDKTQKKPLIDRAAFPGTPNGLFWATRPEANDNLNAWIVNFGNGRVYGNTGSKTLHMRLVHSN